MLAAGCHAVDRPVVLETLLLECELNDEQRKRVCCN